MGNWVVEDYRQQSKDWRSTGIIWAKTEENYYSPGKKICSVSCSNLHAGSDPIEIAEFEANSTFIAHARTDIPKLIEALEEANEKVRIAVEALTKIGQTIQYKFTNIALEALEKIERVEG